MKSLFSYLKIFLIISCILSLSSCGFRPMYTSYNEGPSLGAGSYLSQVDIRPISERRGVLLRQQLNEKFNQDQGSRKIYDLQVQLSSRIQELGVRKDSTSSRANLIISANFWLWQGQKRLVSNRVGTTVSYNILDDQYATIASEADAEARALKLISDQITNRIAIFFSKNVHIDNSKN